MPDGAVLFGTAGVLDGPLQTIHAPRVFDLLAPLGIQRVHLGPAEAAALGESLSGLCFEGPEERLTLTENAQPALMAVSMAIVRVLEREGGAVACRRRREKVGARM